MASEGVGLACVKLRNRREPDAEDYISFPSTGTNNSATMLMILISGLMAGPAVSL